MAQFITIIANSEEVEAFTKMFPKDTILTADTEQEALEIASEHFHSLSAWQDEAEREHMDHILAPGELDAYEIVDSSDKLIGWEVNSI